MKKFQSMAELLAFLLSTDEYPDEMQAATVHAMHKIEACNKGGYSPSYLIIADNETEAALIKKEYVLSGCTPESDVCITTVDGKCWRERVFVFGDAGDGVIYYERVPLLREKCAES